MLYLQIVVSLVLVMLTVTFYCVIINKDQPVETKQTRVTVVVGSVVKKFYRDACSFVTEYKLAGAPQGKKAPIVTFRRFFDGNEDIQISSTPGHVEIKHFGKYKRALLEEALKDIKGQLVDKNA